MDESDVRARNNCSQYFGPVLGFAVLAAVVVICALTYFLIWLASDKPREIRLVNNTGSIVTIRWGRISLPLDSGSVIDLSPHESDLFLIVENGNEIWQYDWPPISYVSTGYGPFSLQIEPNGAIYYLPGFVNRPTDALLPQPSDFPMLPKDDK